MKDGDAQKRATAKYRAANVATVNVRFYPADRDVFDWMTANGYRGSWVRDLIRREYERGTEASGRQ